jgi:hypothetical protein
MTRRARVGRYGGVDGLYIADVKPPEPGSSGQLSGAHGRPRRAWHLDRRMFTTIWRRYARVTRC